MGMACWTVMGGSVDSIVYVWDEYCDLELRMVGYCVCDDVFGMVGYCV